MSQYEPAVHLAAKMTNNILGQKHSQLSEQGDYSCLLSTFQTMLKILCIFGYPRHKEVIDKLQEIDERPDDQKSFPVRKVWRSSTQPGRKTVFGRTQKQISVSMRNIYQESGDIQWCETGRCSTAQIETGKLVPGYKWMDMCNLRAFSLGIETGEIIH